MSNETSKEMSEVETVCSDIESVAGDSLDKNLQATTGILILVELRRQTSLLKELISRTAIPEKPFDWFRKLAD
jgi:hypothetical protein